MKTKGLAVLMQFDDTQFGDSSKWELISGTRLLGYSLVKKSKYHYREFYVGRSRGDHQKSTHPLLYLSLELEPTK